MVWISSSFGCFMPSPSSGVPALMSGTVRRGTARLSLFP